MKQQSNKSFKKVESEFENKVISIRRVTKTTKGGRNLSFSALVAVGNMKGKVGVGSGKDSEVPKAIEKAITSAKKNMQAIPLVGTTIPHEVLGKFSKSSVLLMPAKEGTGVIAGGAARAVIELVGIKDILSKAYGSRNSINSVKATIEGLKSLRTIEQFALLRGKLPEEI
ncbi:MAG: 30S ribosomal protein S5 [Clostridia bacterium]|nr:30S ribosomal protein S5 [Clostridia bacterium]